MKKTVCITGATSGIGEACAWRFAEGGYDLILNGRKQELLDKLSDAISEKYEVSVVTLCFDVRDREAAQEALAAIPEEMQAIDVLINNAGLALGLDKEYDPAAWNNYETMLDTNVKALLSMTQLIVPGMVARNRGHIINIGSVASDIAYPGGSVYCATKFAVKGLTDGLRCDLINTPIRVTHIKPGLVETNFSITRFDGDTERARQVYAGLEPLVGADIADACFYAANAPQHVQVAEMTILATHQANNFVVHREV